MKLARTALLLLSFCAGSSGSARKDHDTAVLPLYKTAGQNPNRSKHQNPNLLFCFHRARITSSFNTHHHPQTRHSPKAHAERPCPLAL